MPAARRSLAWLQWPRRTARLRFTALYGGLFILSGATLVAVTYVLFERLTRYTNPALPKIPNTPSIQASIFPGAPSPSQLIHDQYQLSQVQNQIFKSFPTGTSVVPNGPLETSLSQLTRDQRQLSSAVNQLAQAVHQVARTNSVEAAQRATDSHQLLIVSGIALGIVAILALLVGWLLAGRMLRPLRTITRTAQRISSTSLHERLALEGPQDELKELGDTLDDLFERLESAFEAQRHFVANASHELRTPLTRERTLVQVALGDPSTPEVWKTTGRELLASNREQETLIDALLTLASSEGGIDQREALDLSDIVRKVLSDRPNMDRLGLHIETTISPASTSGDPHLLERLVANLVDNALSHNIEGGQISISTATLDGHATLSVVNTGPVVPRSEIQRLFQPFQRLERHRIHLDYGHGIGLSIVQAIASAHGATIDAQPAPEGGLSVHVTFPASESEGLGP